MLGFASVGFPLTMGFVAEDLLVQGTVDQFPMLGLSLVVATAFNGVSVLRAFFYLFTGSRKSQSEPDLSRRETYVFGVAIAGLLINGLLPGPLVSFEDPHRDASRTHASETPENGTALELGLLDSPAEPMVATSNKTKP
jgi:NADH-quinone oxidoreductase subunit M